jgi:HlyD family secretion protein
MSQGEHIGQIDVPGDGFKIRAAINERYLSQITTGLQATMTYEDIAYTAEVRKIYSDVVNGEFQVDLYFIDESPDHIKRGQTLRMRLNFSSADEALTIRRGNFYQETAGKWIYVVDESGDYAIKREIRIGRQNIREYEILEGLEEGEQVIISGYKNLNEKDKVILK